METTRRSKKEGNLALSLVMGVILTIMSIVMLSVAINVRVELGVLHIAEVLGQCLAW